MIKVTFLCEKLLFKYPNSEIIFMTPLHREFEEVELKEGEISDKIPLSGYVSIIKEVAGYYGLPPSKRRRLPRLFRKALLFPE